MHMNEFHCVGIYDITSPFNDKFHKEQTWAYLDNVNETRELCTWLSCPQTL